MLFSLCLVAYRSCLKVPKSISGFAAQFAHRAQGSADTQRQRCPAPNPVASVEMDLASSEQLKLRVWCICLTALVRSIKSLSPLNGDFVCT